MEPPPILPGAVQLAVPEGPGAAPAELLWHISWAPDGPASAGAWNPRQEDPAGTRLSRPLNEEVFSTRSPAAAQGAWTGLPRCWEGSRCLLVPPFGQPKRHGSHQHHQADAEVGLTGGAGWALPCSPGGPWSCVPPRRSVPPLRPPSPRCGAAVGGPSAQVVAPLRGSAPHPVPGRVPLPAGGRADGILPVVIVGSHRVQDTVKRLPAERARSPPAGPLPDAAEAEAVEAHGHAGCVAHGAQADGAPGICRCLRLPRLLHLPGDGGHRRAALLRGLFAARCHVLPRKTCKVPEL